MRIQTRNLGIKIVVRRTAEVLGSSPICITALKDCYDSIKRLLAGADLTSEERAVLNLLLVELMAALHKLDEHNEYATIVW